MDIQPVPESAKRAHPNHVVVDMGPPPGVSDDDCGTAQMLLGREPAMPGFNGRDQLAYFKPSAADLEVLNAGGLLVMNQLGQVVQPFSVSVWPADRTDHQCEVCGTRWRGEVEVCPMCPVEG